MSISPLGYKAKDDSEKEMELELGHERISNAPSDEVSSMVHITESKLLWRIDCRLMPCVSALILLCFLDRANVGNALVYGFREDIGVSGVQVSTGLTMFFITYTLFEIPWNIALKKFTPRIWLPLCMFGFGLTTLCTGFVRNYAGFIATRLVLGVAEAAIFPGCAYLLGSWYTRKEAQKRFSLYLGMVNLSTGFGGLIAAAIGKMDGACGLAGWRWIFIIEGMLTCVVAPGCYGLLPNFPEQAKWLTAEEREFVQVRLRAEQGSSVLEQRITARDVWEVVKDPRVILAALIHLVISVPGTMGAFFAPTIVENLGDYSPIETQLRTVPVWMVAFALALLVAYASDTVQNRYGAALFCCIVGIAGYAMLFQIFGNVQARYAGLFLAISGVSAMMPVEICWNTMNLGGHQRRAIGSAWQVSLGNVGGIIGTYAFRQQDAPRFQLSYALAIMFTCLAVMFCTMYAGWCWWLNRQRAHKEWGSGMSEEEKDRLGDKSPSYRLML